MTAPTAPLTARQEQILAFITASSVSRGYPPSIREIGDRFKIVSPNGVVAHLKALVKRGRLRRASDIFGMPRSYVPVPATVHALSTARGIVLATAGGPVTFTQAAWVVWLREQLALAAQGQS